MNSDALNLSAGWRLSRIGGAETAPIDFPGDVHSALLAAGLIADPYWRDREMSLDWVHDSELLAERSFDLPATDGRFVLTLEAVDCHAIVTLNGIEIGQPANRFRRYDLDVSDALRPGQNLLSIRFLSNSAIARQKAEASPFPVPYIFWNNRLAHYNFLRKPQCDAGWDWNIALSPLGVYGQITLRRVDRLRLDDVMIRQHHAEGQVRLEVDLIAHADAPTTETATIRIDGQTVTREAQLWPGENRVTLAATIAQPRLWWPAGHGDQALYDLQIDFGGQQRRLKIGLRQIELLTDADEAGHRFAFRVNGREIFMRGANWIPADALPARATPEAVADLLDSAVAANMNMLRVWGGDIDGVDCRVVHQGVVRRVPARNIVLGGERLGPFGRARSDRDQLGVGCGVKLGHDGGRHATGAGDAPAGGLGHVPNLRPDRPMGGGAAPTPWRLAQ